MLFQRNEELLKQYDKHQLQNQETLVDFGVVPAKPLDREDWEAEISCFLAALSSRGYIFQPAMDDGA